MVEELGAGPIGRRNLELVVLSKSDASSSGSLIQGNSDDLPRGCGGRGYTALAVGSPDGGVSRLWEDADGLAGYRLLEIRPHLASQNHGRCLTGDGADATRGCREQNDGKEDGYDLQYGTSLGWIGLLGCPSNSSSF
jgi:hypothetical protein